MSYYKRIRDLREDADKTQIDLAKYLKTTAQYYGKYEKGEREIPFIRAIQLAKYYNVSLDYLAGITNFKHGYMLEPDEENFLKNWHSLSERDKGKVEYLMTELLRENSK
jgi:transcriptional regulator with XRE-family HTH domain